MHEIQTHTDLNIQLVFVLRVDVSKQNRQPVFTIAITRHSIEDSMF